MRIPLVVYKRSKRARRVAIRIKEDGTAVCTHPHSISRRYAEDFVRSKASWIEGHQEKMRVRVRKRIIGPQNNIRINGLPVILEASAVETFKKTAGGYRATYKESEGYSEAHFQLRLKGWLMEELRKAAKIELPRRIDELASEHGMKYNKLQLRNARTRWGSCSAKNNISLNIHLMRVEKELRDYVILHELVHTKIKNHSSRFWSKLEGLYPGAKHAGKVLKTYDLYLFG